MGKGKSGKGVSRSKSVEEDVGSHVVDDIFVGDVKNLYVDDFGEGFGQVGMVERGFGGKEADAQLPVFGETISGGGSGHSGRVGRVVDSSGKDVRKRKKGRESLRVTERDVELLRFLGRYKYATLAQIARYFGTSENAWSIRLPKLNKAGLVFWEWGANARPKMWLATADGLAFAGMDLPVVRKIAWGHLRHTLGLTDLGIGFELAGEVVVTEREIRTAVTRKTRGLRGGVGVGPTDRVGTAVEILGEAGVDGVERLLAVSDTGEIGLDDDRIGVSGHGGMDYVTTGQLVRWGYTVPVRGRGQGRPKNNLGGGVAGLGHVPDMVILRQPTASGLSSNIAVELELTRKQYSEWKNVIEGYANYQGYHQVYYYCVSKSVARGLVEIIRQTPGAVGKIKVAVFEPIDKSGEPGKFGRNKGRNARGKVRPKYVSRVKVGMTLPIVPEEEREVAEYEEVTGVRPAGTEPSVGWEKAGTFDPASVGRGSGSGLAGMSPLAGTTYEEALEAGADINAMRLADEDGHWDSDNVEDVEEDEDIEEEVEEEEDAEEVSEWEVADEDDEWLSDGEGSQAVSDEWDGPVAHVDKSWKGDSSSDDGW